MKYVFAADASVDVPKEFLDKYDIHIIPIELRFGDELFPEGLPNDEFYNRVTTSPVMPKTSMPNSYKFEQFYKDYLNKEDVFVITLLISMDMSPTKLQAQMAAENLGMKNVFIDTTNVTTVAQGAIICELCKFIDKNPKAQPEEVISEFYRLRDKVRLYAIFSDLKYLKASGRLSAASAVVGSMLKVKPIVSIVEGKVTNVAKVVGTPKAEQFVNEKVALRDRSYPLYAIHSRNLPALTSMVEKFGYEKESQIIYDELTYVMATHVGPGVYGFVYFAGDN